MKTTPTFCALSVRSISKTRSISGSVSDVVGSSMMMIDAFIISARAISTICLKDASSVETIAPGSTSISIFSKSAFVRWYIAA